MTYKKQITTLTLIVSLLFATTLFADSREKKKDKDTNRLMDILNEFSSGSFKNNINCDTDVETDVAVSDTNSSLKFNHSDKDDQSTKVTKVQISIKEKILKAFDANGNIVKTYPCATGKASTPTPIGSFKIFSKMDNPAWDNPFTAHQENIPAGPNSPIGTRFMGFENSKNIPGAVYGIHGTNNPDSMGKNASNGCIRLVNKDVEDLFDRIEEGATVIITK